VRKPNKICIGILIVLSGCASPQRTREHPPDWVAEDARIEPEWTPAPPSVPPAQPRTNPPVLSFIRPGETWTALNRWSKENGLGLVEQLAQAPLASFALRTTNGLLVIQAESQTARWDGLEFRLGFAPRLIDGQPFVHALDLQKNIWPLAIGSRLEPKPSRVVVIDPGHGGVNAGTKSALGPHYEKEFTLDWARRLSQLLATNGWRVFLTRTSDVDVSLPDRVAFADQHQADLFLSLHFNSAASGGDQAGLETYCLTPTGMPSTVTRGYDDDTSLVFTNNLFDTENLQYAIRLHRALLPVTGNDRGVRRARFLGVLRGQNRPAVLIEGGYLSNPSEARRIADPAYRQKLAEAVAGALE
jgi:N-acetylmuramoyl-L-alanine amidase